MLGMQFLKGDVSLDRGFAKRLSMTIQEIDKNFELMHLLPQSCMGIAKLFFGPMTCQMIHMEEEII